VLASGGAATAFEIDPAVFGIEQMSATFHGRDLFGPVAAALAAGAVLPAAVGPSRPVPSASHWRAEQRTENDALSAHVIVVDHFGNLITDLEGERLTGDRDWHVLVAGQRLPLMGTYADAQRGQCVALVGSFGTLEIAARDANARELLGASVGQELWVVRG
jgi:S-adenosylmethionine hydrolase